MDDEVKARMGLKECVAHGLLQPFNVLYEREGELVAQFKYTVLLMPNGPKRITGGFFNPEEYETEYKVEDEALKVYISY